MAWTMQIRESYSYTMENESAGLSSPASSISRNYKELHQYLQNHVHMLIESLGDLTINTSAFPISTAIPFDWVFVNIDRCQQHLSWYLPEDIWTDDIEEWLEEIPYFPVEVHPAPATHPAKISRSSSTTSSERWRRMFPSFQLPNYDVFTNHFWKDQVEQYSPSIYSQDEFGISHPIGEAARQLLQEVAGAPINHINIQDILAIIPKMQEVCTEIHVSIIKAEDSMEFNTDSNSDISLLDLNAIPSPTTNFYQIARSRGLTISTRNPPSDNGGLTSPTHNFICVRGHHISPDIYSRISRIAATRSLKIQVLQSPMYDSAPLTDRTCSNSKN